MALIRCLEQTLSFLLRILLLSLLLPLEAQLGEALLEILQLLVVCIVGRVRRADQLLANVSKLHLCRCLDSATLVAANLVARLLAVHLARPHVLLAEGLPVGLAAAGEERAAEAVRTLRLLEYLARVARYRVGVDGERVSLRSDVGWVHGGVGPRHIGCWAFSN